MQRRTIVQVGRIDRYDGFTYCRGKYGRAVTLSTSELHHFRAGSDIPVSQEVDAVLGLGVLDLEVI